MEKKGEESQRGGGGGGAYEGGAFITGGGNMRGGFIVPKRVHASHPMSPPNCPRGAARGQALEKQRESRAKALFSC